MVLQKYRNISKLIDEQKQKKDKENHTYQGLIKVFDGRNDPRKAINIRKTQLFMNPGGKMPHGSS